MLMKSIGLLMILVVLMLIGNLMEHIVRFLKNMISLVVNYAEGTPNGTDYY